MNLILGVLSGWVDHQTLYLTSANNPIINQRVLQGEGESPVSWGLPETASPATDGGGPPGLHRLDHPGGGAGRAGGPAERHQGGPQLRQTEQHRGRPPQVCHVASPAGCGW